MAGAHLSLDVWARWLSGRLEHEEQMGELVPHVLSLCPACREIHEELERITTEVGHWDEWIALSEGREAPELWTSLAALPYQQQMEAASRGEGFHAWGLCQLLLGKSREAVFSDPTQAVDLASLAAKIAAHLGDAYDPSWVADLEARAAATLGNALRVLGELKSADLAFRQAHEHLEHGTGDPLVEAGILDLEASLRRAQRRFGEATELLDRVLAAYRAAGDSGRIARVLLNKAKIAAEMGQLEAAVTILREAGPLVERADSRLGFYVQHNLLYYLTELGHFSQADSLFSEVWARAVELGDDLDRVRLRWLEGRITLGLGRLGPAEAAFREAQQAFLDRRMAYDAALVVLDLAMLFAQEGATADLKRLALEVVPVFESREIRREAMAALLMFQHACEEETLTVKLIQHLATLPAARARRAGALRVEPARRKRYTSFDRWLPRGRGGRPG